MRDSSEGDSDGSDGARPAGPTGAALNAPLVLGFSNVSICLLIFRNRRVTSLMTALMIVALAASTAFMTPISSPVNTLVVAPGNYGFGDFVKVGVPFSLVVMAVSVLLVPWLLPLHPH